MWDIWLEEGRTDWKKRSWNGYQEKEREGREDQR